MSQGKWDTFLEQQGDSTVELLAPDMLEDSLRNKLLALDILERESADSTVELLALVIVEQILQINYLHPSFLDLKHNIWYGMEKNSYMLCFTQQRKTRTHGVMRSSYH